MRYKHLFITILVCLCVTSIVVPTLLQRWTVKYPLSSSPDTLFVQGRENWYTGEDTLGSKAQKLQRHIADLERVQVSVRNEMREVEKERYQILQEMEAQKSASYNLENTIHQNKKTLLSIQNEILKTSHDLYGVTQKPSITVYQPPPIVVLPPSSPIAMTTKPGSSYLARDAPDCGPNPDKCLDLLKCPLTRNFKVFLYSSSDFKFSISQDTHIFTLFKDYLKDTDSLTTDPNEACLFILLLVQPTDNGKSPSFAESVISLPHWHKSGVNHVLVNTFVTGVSTNARLLQTFNHSLAVLVDVATTDYWRRGYDIIVPPTGLKVHDGVHDKFEAPPSIVPAYRKYFVHFVGQLASRAEPDGGVTMAMFLSLPKATNESIIIKTDCGAWPVNDGFGIWSLCGSEDDRAIHLIQSTYTIIPSTTTDIAMTTRLREALKQGAIPVIVGGAPLPLESVIDWSMATIRVPLQRFHEVFLFLRSRTHDEVLQLRHRGLFLYQTYFSSPLQILKSVTAVLRHRMLHPPPPTPEVTPHRWHSYASTTHLPIYTSPTYLSNYSVYGHRFWNEPPGPFYMYPHTPWAATPITGSHYVSMTREELAKLPPHIVLGGGITGPYFENYLLGNTPEEHFTVVILTYKREEVVCETIQRLDGLSYLSKVVVVWNDVDSDPYGIKWPRISAPVEVIRSEENSLNSRFIPYTNIETEAVLSLDDDVYLRHDEIQFAFRVWRESRDRLVGFPGRFHSYNIRNKGWLYNSNYTCELSMVLTGAAFLHKYYLYLYTQWQPSVVRQMVDRYMNCEDIAMNFLVSHITRKPPLKVTSRWTFRCTDCPEALSQSDKHFNERHDCINQLTRIYGYVPLLYTQYRLDSVLFKTKLPSHLEKCYQYV